MAAHYQAGVEERRLATWGRLELIRTMEILHRYLPVPPAVIVDVGGGPGAYALPLAAGGYLIHLLDPMALHIEQAQQASAAQAKGGLASIQQGDARELPWSDESADVALLLDRSITSRGPKIASSLLQRSDECFVLEAYSLPPRSPDSRQPTMAWREGFSPSRCFVRLSSRTFETASTGIPTEIRIGSRPRTSIIRTN
ncbi:MAG: class I SAM-dependent methyltransferase [Solirubrobacterales bacterium]